MSADNQQERLDENWIAGFVDGEGNFSIQVNRNEKLKRGYQILPQFRIVQHKRDRLLLEKIKLYFNFGVVRKNNNNCLEYRVRSIEDQKKIVSFFTRYPLQTKKKNDFLKYKKIIELLPLTDSNLLNLIYKIKRSMNKY